jgi:hypothetical protein
MIKRRDFLGTAVAAVVLAANHRQVMAASASIDLTIELVEADAIDGPTGAVLETATRTVPIGGTTDFLYTDGKDGRQYRVVFKNLRLAGRQDNLVTFRVDWVDEAAGSFRERLGKMAVEGEFGMELYGRPGGGIVMLRMIPKVR